MDITQASWLKSESKWSSPLGRAGEWTGTKVLGKGGYGIAGLWTYTGRPTERMIQHVVVKQAEVVQGRPVGEEGKLLELYSKVRSKHVIRQYGTYHVDKYAGRPVMRLYLEFCPSGELARFLKGPRVAIEEGDLWQIFHCLALAVSALHRGTEDLKSLWERDVDLVHFDIHLRNVLLGYRDAEHSRVPICKIVDFGEAIEVPKNPRDQQPFYIRGMKRNAPPENDPDVNAGPAILDNRKGYRSNIYQIGMIMYQLMLKTRNYDIGKPRPGLSHLNERLERGYTHGIRVEAETNYSVGLKTLVMECMMREPSFRPSDTELQQVTLVGVRYKADKAAQPVIGDLILGNVPVIGPDFPNMYPRAWKDRSGGNPEGMKVDEVNESRRREWERDARDDQRVPNRRAARSPSRARDVLMGMFGPPADNQRRRRATMGGRARSPVRMEPRAIFDPHATGPLRRRSTSEVRRRDEPRRGRRGSVENLVEKWEHFRMEDAPGGRRRIEDVPGGRQRRRDESRGRRRRRSRSRDRGRRKRNTGCAPQ